MTDTPASPNLPPVATTESESKRLKDVWSRSGSKYRIRAIVLLGVNVLLFAGVGSFAFWIRSGEFFAPARDGYADILIATFTGVGEASVSLGSLLAGPVGVENVPMMIPIVGLLMATLIAIPILVAILYRFWSSIPFIAVVGLIAVMPWLAITLLGSCILASVRPFRTRFRFMSALIALIPAIVYLVLAWNGTHDAVVGRIDPVDAIKYVAPWVLAVVAGACVFAVVLSIADFVDYRPGAVTPLLAIMLAIPVALFEQRVGRDELYYRLLEQLDLAHFAEVDATVSWEEAARRRWETHPLPRPSWNAVREIEAEKWQMELASDTRPYESELARHQAEIADRCDWFRKYFPDSRYTPNALFIKARALDRRVDLVEFRETKWIRFYDEFPSVASRETWRIILQNRPDTLLGAIARCRLAHIESREGDVDRAIDRLAELIAKFDRRQQSADKEPGDQAPSTTGLQRALERESPESSLHVSIDRMVLEAHRLYDLLTRNRDPLYDYAPLCGPRRADGEVWYGMLDLDPRHGSYVRRLERLAKAYPNAQIGDNIELEIAKATRDPVDRISRLEQLVARVPAGDATAEALLRLSLTYREIQHSRESEEVVTRLVTQYPESIWTKQADKLSPLAPSRRVTSREP